MYPVSQYNSSQDRYELSHAPAQRKRLQPLKTIYPTRCGLSRSALSYGVERCDAGGLPGGQLDADRPEPLAATSYRLYMNSRMSS